MNVQELGRIRGRQAAARAVNFPRELAANFDQWRILYPTAAAIDFATTIRDLDRKRLDEVPSLAQFPELAGHADLLRAERQAFREVSGFDETTTACFYSWDFFMRRPLNAQHLARWENITAEGCTNVFIPGGAEGVTIGDNRDIGLLDDMSGLAQHRPAFLFTSNRDGVHYHQGAVSSAVLLDDEPTCSFPADPFDYTHLIPRECLDDIDAFAEFLTRYNEFWGPCNKILVDSKMRAIAAEKSNCKVAFRKPTVNGAIAITACAYLDEDMHNHQLSRAAKAAEIKGESTEDNLDYNYHLGCRQRYRRLVELANTAAQGQPTIWDLLEMVADHAVPYPDRVCLAGESRNSSTRNPHENWSVTQHAAVISGDRKRALYRSVQSRAEPKPVYEYTPKLVLDTDVAMRPEWQNDIDSGRCLLDTVPLSD